MRKTLSLAALINCIALAYTPTAAADGKAQIISQGQKAAPGVEVSAQSFVPARQRFGVESAQRAEVVTSGWKDSSAVVVAVQPHSCAPVYGTGGIPVSYTFSPVAAGDCVSFAPPPPVDPGPRPGPGPRRRPRPSPEELARIAADEAIALAADPELRIAPAEIGLTGLDSYFWLDEEPQPISAIAQVPGLQVTAEARPLQYVWDFGDGDQDVTGHPGRPWTSHVPGNVAHLYETRGRYELGVEVVWEARWRTGAGEWQHLGYFSNSDTAEYPVRQMVPVLTRTPR